LDSAISVKLAQAIALQQKGKTQEATKVYQNILVTHPDHESANVNLGILQFHEGRVKEGLMLLRKAVVLHPKSANANFNLAYACMKSGKLQEAIENNHVQNK